VGRFLSVLSASVPSGGRIVELGTGTGVGTAWLVHGLGGRRDVEVVSVEADQETAALVINHTWPSYVRFLVDDVVKALPFLGTFDLVFADAPGGKWERLDLSINALNVGGLLVVDDMTPQVGWTADQSANQEAVRMTLLEHPRLVTCDVEWATGIILSVRKG
jgi:demethylmenaquinone methyltransferase/2-methoxy-6-polyprenyl-1,4-benzoquinol methylase